MGGAVRLTIARFTDDNRAEWLASSVSALIGAEREHVSSIVDANARTQHALGRALIRLIGAEATGQKPARVVVAVSELGKPRLVNLPDLHLSVAHTGCVVVVAACLETAVGVDIEPALSTAAHPRRLAERLFADAELAQLRDMPEGDLAGWLASAWTIKEAVGKALGVGIVPALSGALVEVRSEGLVLASVWSGPPIECWSVHQLTAPDGGEKIAVALPGPGIELEPLAQLTLETFSSRLAVALA